MKCLWGMSSKMRCTEVVIGILNDPTKVDHTYAAAYRAIIDARRMLGKQQSRYDQFMHNIQKYHSACIQNATVGPVHGFLMHIATIGATVHIANDRLCIDTQLGARIDLMRHPLTHIQACLRM